jgi:hypothetical protein
MGTGAGAAGQTILIPYQRTEPHGFPAVDPSLDITSPPLRCIDTGTIWSQPGNFYTHIVNLGTTDNSRSMIAPGNSEDGAWRTNQIGIWAKGTTHAATLSAATRGHRAASEERAAPWTPGGGLTRRPTARATVVRPAGRRGTGPCGLLAI